MKFFIISNIFLISVTVNANSLVIPPDVMNVITVDGKYEAKYSNATRERFITRYSLGGEGSQDIVIEKFAPGRYGWTDKIISSSEKPVSDLPIIKDYISKVAIKSVEATYGCCTVYNIKKSDDKWNFSVRHSKVIFSCQAKENINENKYIFSCSK